MRMKPGYTDAFWVSILLMVYMILIKNKNKNKNKNNFVGNNSPRLPVRNLQSLRLQIIRSQPL